MALDITPANEVHGDFGLKRSRTLKATDLAAALAIAAAVWLVGQTLCTQWLARRLAYQAALGEPWFWVRQTPVYPFWAAGDWVDAMAVSVSAAALTRSFELAGHYVLAFAFLAAAITIGKRRQRAKNRADELHGSARWAERDDIARAGLLTHRGVIVGAWEDPRARKSIWLRHDGPEHALMFAPTGSGKGVGVVIPTLLTWLHSAIVLDPKGENFALTSGYRASLGHNVFNLDFAAREGQTARFNPLDAVRLGTPQEVADAQRIARMLADPDGSGAASSSKHWTENAAALLAGAILHVLYRAKGHGQRASLVEVLHELTHPTKSHVDVLREWLTYPHDPRYVQGWVDPEGAATATHPLVAAAARTQLNREQAERSGVASSALTPLQIFLDPLLAANTSASDFEISDLMDADRPTSVYLVMRPDDTHRLRPIMRVLLDLWIRRLVEKMEFAGGRSAHSHRHRLLLLLDEFPVLGRMDIIRESLAYVRGWGIKAMLITQDTVQLRESYGRDESITSNCHLRLAYAPNHTDTAKLLSQMTGTSTAIRKSRQQSTGVAGGLFSRNSHSENEVARPLLTPDECMRLAKAEVVNSKIVRPGEMLIFAAGSPPIYGRQPLYFTDPILKTRASMPAAAPGYDAANTPKRGGAKSAPAPAAPSVGQDRAEQDAQQQEGACEGAREDCNDTPAATKTPTESDRGSCARDASTPPLDSLLSDPEFAAMAAMGLEEEA